MSHSHATRFDRVFIYFFAFYRMNVALFDMGSVFCNMSRIFTTDIKGRSSIASLDALWVQKTRSESRTLFLEQRARFFMKDWPKIGLSALLFGQYFEHFG